MPSKYSFVSGYKIVVSEKGEYSKQGQCLSFVPTAHYKFQGMSDQLDLGIYSIYNQIILGLWYRGIPIKNYKKIMQNNESMVLLGGWKIKSISMSYSYDFVISKLASVKTLGSHEVNLTYLYMKSKKSKPTRRLPCPKFYDF